MLGKTEFIKKRLKRRGRGRVEKKYHRKNGERERERKNGLPWEDG